jgi:hypothetical protein
VESISYSEIKLHRRCAKAHQYRYRDRLKRRRPNRPAFVGTILHEMLDARMKGKEEAWEVYQTYKDKYAKLFREEKEEFGDIPALVKAIYKGYWRRWKNDGLVYVKSEVEFRVELTPKIELMGYIDKIAQDGRRRSVLDHKFHKNLPGPEDRFADIQTVLYYWGWNEFVQKRADRVDGVIWDYGRMKAPAIPEVLKNGQLSQRKNIDTDRYTYLKTILANGLDPKPYQGILKSLEGKERTFFERVPLPAPPKVMVTSVVEDARLSAIQAKKALKTGKAPRSMSGFNCNGCEFRKICEAEIRGHDTKFLLKKEYEIRPERVKETKYGEVEEAA